MPKTQVCKIIISVLTLITVQSVFGDQSGTQLSSPRPRPPVEPALPPQSYDDECAEISDCQEENRGRQFDPQQNYYCNPVQPCQAPYVHRPRLSEESVLPWGPPPVLLPYDYRVDPPRYYPRQPPPIVVRPLYPPPVYYPPPHYRRGPGFPHHRGGHHGHRGFRRMSNRVSCEIQQGNNGEVVLLDKAGYVLFANSSPQARQLVEVMKAYYSQVGFDFCSESEIKYGQDGQDI